MSSLLSSPFHRTPSLPSAACFFRLPRQLRVSALSRIHRTDAAFPSRCNGCASRRSAISARLKCALSLSLSVFRKCGINVLPYYGRRIIARARGISAGLRVAESDLPRHNGVSEILYFITRSGIRSSESSDQFDDTDAHCSPLRESDSINSQPQGVGLN